MAYKIKWRRGGETAERYATKVIGKKILKKSNLSGAIFGVGLGYRF